VAIVEVVLELLVAFFDGMGLWFERKKKGRK
jgi:Na+-transporting methylmalonyl-CoA/oxaloacetate decarboxylase gamma subunit